MGVHTAEIFTNMGLCCFYAQHLDMAISCFQRALGLASDNLQGDIWYNIGHVALVGVLVYAGWYFIIFCVGSGFLHSVLLLFKSLNIFTQNGVQ